MVLKNEKRLQKVTDITSIVDLKTYKEFMRDNDVSPKMVREIMKHVDQKINEAYSHPDIDETDYLDILCFAYDSIEGREKDAEIVRNKVYELNQQIIASCIHNHMLDKGCSPTVSTIASKTNLSRTTIYRHLRNDYYGPTDKFVKGKFEVMATSAMEQLYKIGVEERNPSALKTFIEFVNGGKTTTNINNYIQINNIRLSQEDIQRLPLETIEAIEMIIEQSLNS